MGWIADLLNEIPSAAHYKIELEKLASEHENLKLENAVLKDKIKTFESQLEDATKEIQKQNQIIKALQKPKGIEKYDPITEKTLKLFFETGRELSIPYVAAALSMDINTIRYHFDLLSKDDLIIQTKYGTESSWARENSPDMYDLTPSGRKYIVENKLT